MDFTKFALKFETLNLLPYNSVYIAIAIIGLSLILGVFPKLEIIFNIFLILETVFKLCKYLQNKMFDVKILKSFVFYYLIFIALNLISPLTFLIQKIMPVCFIAKFIFLLYFSVNMEKLLFLEEYLANLRMQKNTQNEKLKADLENVKSKTSQKMNDLKRD